MQEFVAHVQRNFFPDAGSEGAIGGNDDNTLAVAGHADLPGLLINGISANLLRAKVDRCRTHGDWTASPPASRSGNMVWMPEKGVPLQGESAAMRRTTQLSDFITEPGRPYGGGLP